MSASGGAADISGTQNTISMSSVNSPDQNSPDEQPISQLDIRSASTCDEVNDALRSASAGDQVVGLARGIGCLATMATCMSRAPAAMKPEEPSGLVITADPETDTGDCIWVPTSPQLIAPPPPPTSADVAREMKTLPFPVPEFHTNPPGPMCAVLGLTNYYYVTPPSTDPITTTILGTAVTVYPRITEYTFDFGDETSPLTTTDPGGPYPDGRNTHVYAKSGHYRSTVTVTWGADWSATGIPRQPVPGTAATTSTPTDVWAHAYRIVLVADPNYQPAPPDGLDPADPCFN